MTVIAGAEPILLYPKAGQFPFDKVCEQIVRGLEARNWTVPGISVEFEVYYARKIKRRMVRCIQGENFKLTFDRPNNRSSADVVTIIIPRRELKVSRYGLGPSLIHDSDTVNKFSHEAGETKIYDTKEVFAEFTEWLKTNLLARILAQPVPPKRKNIFFQETIPYPKNFGPLYCFGDSELAEKIYKGKLDTTKLTLSDRYAFGSDSHRLIVSGDGSVETHYDSYSGCGIGEVEPTASYDELKSRRVGSRSVHVDDAYIIRIKPNRANGLYVADYAACPKREGPSSVSLTEWWAPEEAETIVPLAEYTGGYKKPYALLNRELGLDEVSIVSGPWPYCQYVPMVINHNTETRTLLQLALDAKKERDQDPSDKSRGQAYRPTVKRLAAKMNDNQEFLAAARHYMWYTRHANKIVRFVERVVDAAEKSRTVGLV